MNYGRVLLTPERRRWLLREAVAEARAGDLLFFYHRTSWRSLWIRRITACELPHVCVYLGDGRIVGMLRGRVRRHLLRRFLRDEYEVRFVRGSPKSPNMRWVSWASARHGSIWRCLERWCFWSEHSEQVWRGDWSRTGCGVSPARASFRAPGTGQRAPRLDATR